MDPHTRRTQTKRFTETKTKAERGDAGAQYTLGWMYCNGRGVKQDDSLAVDWYRKAAEQGDASSQ